MKKAVSLVWILTVLVMLGVSVGLAQMPDSVDVTFYYRPDGNPSVVFVPGEFNNWGPNQNGAIAPDAPSRMDYDPVTGRWFKTVRLRIGGPSPLPSPNSIPGAYQYKFNENGSPGGWLPDPLNPRQNPSDFNNSYLFIKDPTIHYLLPNATQAVGVIRTRFPEISAYIFPRVGFQVDTSSLVIQIDNQTYTGLGSFYDPQEKRLAFVVPQPLSDGIHSLKLIAASTSGSLNSDSTTFTVQARPAQFLTRPATTWKSQWRLQGAFFGPDGQPDSSVTSAQIHRADSAWTVSVVNARLDTSLSLLEGINGFWIEAVVGGVPVSSDTLEITRLVNHAPTASVQILPSGNTILLDGSASSDPEGGTLTYLWRERADNPEPLGLDGLTSPSVTIPRPTTPGEYFLSLQVTDPENLLDSTWTFFKLQVDSPFVQPATFASNPDWIEQGRVYLLFFKAFTPQGTIQAAIPRLDYIKAMGFNIIWVMPVMDVDGDIDNRFNIGYNIIDFFKVDPVYGTNQDFQEFLRQAHQRGIHVILDITPNHTGRNHPFAQEARTYRTFSQYWNYYQTEFIPHNTNGLGQCSTPEGIYYYCGFSDALLNWNWADLDARLYMIDVYRFWVGQMGVDGFRFDVYWGPHRRYGEAAMGVPVRQALHHIDPDILLLGEDSGTGVGTEFIYADAGGGLDAAYDFKLYFNQIRNFQFTSFAIDALHAELDNGGFYPGENAFYLRFMETQDEDRIAYLYNSFEKTMPMATVLFTAPGLPLLYNGQEVGWGKGISDFDTRRRGVIDWNFAGKALLQPHYQRLAQIRAQFPAFWQHKKDTNGDGQVNNLDRSDFIRVNTTNGLVYAFLRPYLDENGLTVVNFSNSTQTASMNVLSAGLQFTGGVDPAATYWVNNLYADTSYQVQGGQLASFQVTLPPYGSAVFVISTAARQVNIPPLPVIVSVADQNLPQPRRFRLDPNYPNPFNPETRIRFALPHSERVRLTVYNIRGQRVKTLLEAVLPAGEHQVRWNGTDQSGRPVGSGIYLLRMEAGGFVQTRKMVLLK
ncbi:MAG: T9SS C-terminal target domain-containing protein [Calditrichaeota bacterium]|nr:MAG: T9SS C-terminal target domain-containing protein [Calditrichota bacterium]